MRRTTLAITFVAEFVVVIPGCDIAAAFGPAERIRESVRKDAIETCEAPISVTVSLGVAMHGEGSDAESLIRAVDEALYRAKSAGRNRIEVAA